MAWYIQHFEDTGALSYNFEFLMGEYTRIFGEAVMNSVDCTIYNDPSAPCPQCYYSYPARIRLHQSSFDYWAQTVYQLSHEMMHYALFSARGQSKGYLTWVEEIICEAMSHYALEYAATNWNRCRLSRINAGFTKSLWEYLDDVRSAPADGGLASCTTVDRLLSYEKNRTAENHRASFAREREILYQHLRKCPEAAVGFLRYPRFVRADGVTIDFDAFRRSEPRNPLIPVLGSLQPVK